MKTLIVALSALLFASCSSAIKVRTERGTIVTAYAADHTPVILKEGQNVTLYTTRFDSYILSTKYTPTGVENIDGHDVYRLQGVVVKAN